MNVAADPTREFLIDPEVPRSAARVAQGRTGGFLHDVAERAGQLELAASADDTHLDVEDLAAGRGIREPAGHADGVLERRLVGIERGRSEQLG